MKILINTLSTNMIAEDIIKHKFVIEFTAADWLDYHAHESFINSEELARILDVPHSKNTIRLKPDDDIILVSYRGIRIPKGETQLPSGSVLNFFKVRIKPL